MTNKFAPTYRSLESSKYFFGSYMTNGRQRVKALSTIAAIALSDKIKNIKCHVSKKRKCNMYNFASAIKLKHEYKILPRSKPKVLQRKTELSRYVL